MICCRIYNSAPGLNRVAQGDALGKECLAVMRGDIGAVYAMNSRVPRHRQLRMMYLFALEGSFYRVAAMMTLQHMTTEH